MNVSNIISSLVEANKNKLINKPIQPMTTIAAKRDDILFNKEDFKLFPNKKNSSIYEPSSASKVSTSRSKYDDKSFEFNSSVNRNSLTASENARRTGSSSVHQASSFGSNQKDQSRGSISIMGESGKDSGRGGE